MLSILQDLNDPEASLQLQPQFGSRLGPEDFLLFQVQTHKPDETAYLLDLYCGDPQAPDAEPPDHVGFAYVLPSVMRASEGFLVVPITSTKHRPIGQLSSRYLFLNTQVQIRRLIPFGSLSYFMAYERLQFNILFLIMII